MRLWPFLLFPCVSIVATAHNSSAKSATGTVIGHIYCADTNAPARMAQVQLESAEDADQRAAGHPRGFINDTGSGNVVQTALDGSFTISSVPPGSYYVVVTAAGYLSPRAHGEGIDDAEPQPPAGQPLLVIPKVDVEPDQTANVDIRLDRGAAVSGTIRFDDGSPAPGVQITLLHKSKDKWVPSQPTQFSMRVVEPTDDLGHYRISGLRDREYLLQGILTRTEFHSIGRHVGAMIGTGFSSINVYSGDTTRRRDAVPFKLGAGEERTGEDITIPLSKFHSVSGVVTAARDGHAVNGGSVQISTPEDKEVISSAELGSDGSFHLEGVPEGSYLLRVNARDKAMQELHEPGQVTPTSFVEKTIHQYGDLDQTIKVEGDVPNLILAVPEPKNQATASTIK
jgi:hypothetical protein